MLTKNNPSEIIRFYGRRKSHPLKEAQKDLMLSLPEFDFDAGLINPGHINALEIGFGGGEHLAYMAQQNPHVHYFGAEVFQNGIVSLLRSATENAIQNVHIYPGDIRLILKDFPENSLDAVYLLFPDPWPKARHAKRRFIQKETISLLSHILKPGGLWYIASDHPIYQEWVEAQMHNQTFFAQRRPDLSERPDPTTWPITRYEKKAHKEGRTPHFWIFERL